MKFWQVYYEDFENVPRTWIVIAQCKPESCVGFPPDSKFIKAEEIAWYAPCDGSFTVNGVTRPYLKGERIQ